VVVLWIVLLINSIIDNKPIELKITTSTLIIIITGIFCLLLLVICRTKNIDYKHDAYIRKVNIDND
jgi:hypothetical protein